MNENINNLIINFNNENNIIKNNVVKNTLNQSKSFDILFSNRHQHFVNLVNQNNIEDLDALYFNDKVDTKKTENSVKNMKKFHC